MAVSKSFNLSCTSPSKSHQLSGDPYHRKQGGIGINSEVFNKSHWNDNPHLNPVLEITKPRSWLRRKKRMWTDSALRVFPELFFAAKKEAPFVETPICSLPPNKNTTQTIHKRIFGALRLQATKTSRQGRGPSGGAKIIVLCVFGCWFEASSTANNGDIQWKGGALVAQILSTWVPREGFRRNGKKSTSWLAKEFTGWKCVNEATTISEFLCLPSTSPLRRLP